MLKAKMRVIDEENQMEKSQKTNHGEKQ